MRMSKANLRRSVLILLMLFTIVLIASACGPALSIVGFWHNTELSWEFEFKSDMTFTWTHGADVFSGTYVLDAGKGTGAINLSGKVLTFTASKTEIKIEDGTGGKATLVPGKLPVPSATPVPSKSTVTTPKPSTTLPHITIGFITKPPIGTATIPHLTQIIPTIPRITFP